MTYRAADVRLIMGGRTLISAEGSDVDPARGDYRTEEPNDCSLDCVAVEAAYEAS